MPSEIREMIWTCALGDRQLIMEEGRVTNVTRRLQRNEIKFTWEKDEYAPPDDMASNLLRVNRQIRAEAEPILYGTNLFTFDVNQSLPKWLASLTDRQKPWVKAIGLFWPWRLAMVDLSKAIKWVVLPQTIESFSILHKSNSFDGGKCLETALIDIASDLNEAVYISIQNSLKVKDISINLWMFEETRASMARDDEWELARRAMAYCRDKALEYVRSEYIRANPTNDTLNTPYQWLAGETPVGWLFHPRGTGPEDPADFLLNDIFSEFPELAGEDIAQWCYRETGDEDFLLGRRGHEDFLTGMLSKA